jgi:TonB family protein
VPVPPVVTNVFSNTAAPAVASVTARSAENAGFGDIQGSRAPAQRGVVGGTGTLAGFDVGGAAGGVRGGTGRGTVMAAGFGAPAEATKAAANPLKPVQTKIEKPVEILFKPRPDYTDEARKMRIEGEVLLRILFASTGEARVLEVIRGLGHGLNENAIKAAEHIRFKPAQRTNQPVDSMAIVHIVFQLAY